MVVCALAKENYQICYLATKVLQIAAGPLNRRYHTHSHPPKPARNQLLAINLSTVPVFRSTLAKMKSARASLGFNGKGST
jgi:hypothetical protein